jgi:vesicular inhibitory amino acid transporter
VSQRRLSFAPTPGESGNGQTLFNSVAVLVGVGLLSMPLAFSYAGWIWGTIMLVGFSYLTCHTCVLSYRSLLTHLSAKLLARLVIADSSLMGYTDIGRKAFGSWIGGVTNLLFCIELFAFR